MASLIPTEDLPALALTCNSTRHIAQDILYRSPTIRPDTCPWHDCDSRCNQAVYRFARTMLNRPDLALKVRDFAVTAGHEYDSVSRDPTFKDTLDCAYGQLKTFEELAQDHVGQKNQGPEDIPPHNTATPVFSSWKDRLCKGKDIAWVGLILGILAGLQTLKISLLTEGKMQKFRSDDSRRYEISPFTRLFGSSGIPPGFGLSMLPGLQGVKHLSCSVGKLDWDWCMLPSLEKMDIDPDCFYDRQLESMGFAPSQVRSIHLQCSIWAFARTGPRESDTDFPHGRFLMEIVTPKNFPALQNLSLGLDNIHQSYPPATVFTDDELSDEERIDHARATVPLYYILENIGSGDCNVLLQHLEGFSPTLKSLSLCLGEYDEIWYLDYISPARTYAQFESLETLEIPPDLLLGPEYGDEGADWTPKHVTELLPASLKALIIEAPTMEIRGFFDELAQNRAAFPNLSRIFLKCRNDRGESFPVMCYDYHHCWWKLQAAGVDIGFGWRDDDWEPEWADEDWEDPYEPDVSAIVEFLNCL